MRASPFHVHVGRVLKSRDPRRERVSAPIDDLFVSGSEVPAGAEVEVDVVLEPVGATVEAIGTVSAPWTGQCRRCLQPARGVLTADVHEVFEADFVEGESYPLAHEQIDLEPLAREAVVLELPPAPLCKEDCRGLCAQCGTDLNEGSCSCEAPVDPRWAALDELRTED
ncbi:MAG TPA: DUF177 domain-containing protein [Acidimicrobiales bacterium]|jgi:uncharacterized protein|nr:DUF177 domain-containing protein [Acidimicrobiales bacterium]